MITKNMAVILIEEVEGETDPGLLLVEVVIGPVLHVADDLPVLPLEVDIIDLLPGIILPFLCQVGFNLLVNRFYIPSLIILEILRWLLSRSSLNSNHLRWCNNSLCIWISLDDRCSCSQLLCSHRWCRMIIGIRIDMMIGMRLIFDRCACTSVCDRPIECFVLFR